jgi:outer membrane lipoprotein carrier protein
VHNKESRIQHQEFRIIRLGRTDYCLLTSEFVLFILISVTFFLITVEHIQADTSLPLDQIIEKVQEVYNHTEDVQADFDQETRMKSWGQTQVAKGKVSFKKNGRMCWEYSAPVPQQIISDGKKVWFYVPQDRQVTVYEMNQGLQSEIASRLMLGKVNLNREFDIALTDSPGDDKNYCRLRLKPLKPQAAIEQIVLKVDMKSFQVFETEIVDTFGNSNRIRFSHIKVNSHLPDSQFVFTVPAGVDVITSPQAPVSR